MLIETFDYAVTNREKILSEIDFEKDAATIHRAKAKWNEYEPVEKDGNLVGIDSSWNFIPYQGFYIYAVDAVSMKGDGTYLVPPDFDVDLSTLTVQLGNEFVSSPSLGLESIGMEYEFNQARACVGKSDLILVDGSILASDYDRKRKKEGPFYEYARELMREKTLLFLSKMSFSNITLDGALGDMFYYNKASSKPGYSEPHINPERSDRQLCEVGRLLAMRQIGDPWGE